jgi:hypothetical protein
MTRALLMLFVGSMAFVCLSSPVEAAWPEGGVPVCTEILDQDGCTLISDGQGGSIISWNDNRSGIYNVYLQRLDENGNEMWTPGGLRLTSLNVWNYYPALISDGEGGVIVAWMDQRNMTDYDIYAQRIDIDGAFMWTTNGVLICGAAGNQLYPVIATDGAGGAIIAWEDSRGSIPDIYAERITADGTPSWSPNGISVCTASGSQNNLSITAGSAEEAAITWVDMRSTHAIYAQLVSYGSTAWTYDGLLICQTSGARYDPKIEHIGNNYFIVAWEDDRGADIDIYAQVIDPYGTAGWTSNGIAVSAGTGREGEPRIASYKDGTAFIAWWDQSGWDDDIFAQKLDYNGNALWTAGGVTVCGTTGDQSRHDVELDGEGGILVAFNSFLDGTFDVYAQRLDGDGNQLWPESGVLIAEDPDANLIIYPTGYSQDTDGDNGSIVTWYRSAGTGTQDIYAQRIEKNGYWGDPSPVIQEARDVPGDEGGSVNLAWDACRADNDDRHLASHYTVWRAIGQDLALMSMENGIPMVGSAAELPSRPETGTIRAELLGASTFYWKLVSTLDSYYLDAYSEVVATLFDSTAVSSEYHYFQVIAHTAEPSNFWTSAPDSGYSVDNLAPVVPLGLAGEQSFTPEGIQLTWEGNSETDLSGYRIYRGTDENFEPGEGSLLTSVPDTLYFDAGWAWESGYYYKLAAVDVHGNESDYALLSPVSVTGDDPMPLPDATFLSQNFPNPFNPATSISFGLKDTGHVSLNIYDAAGRLVKVLVDSDRSAGNYTEHWDGITGSGTRAASGVYFYRLNAGTFIETKKMILLK